MIVFPVVAFLTNPVVIQSLSPEPKEVDAIFDHPLISFLDPTSMNGEPVSDDWEYADEFYVSRDSGVAWLI